MKVQLQKLTNYNLKEGVYIGRIAGHQVLKNPGKNSGDTVRLRFEFSSSKSKNIEYVGWNQYDLNDEDSAGILTEEIQSLFDDRIWDLVDNRGMFDLDNLTDEVCEVLVAKYTKDEKAAVDGFGPIGMFSEP